MAQNEIKIHSAPAADTIEDVELETKNLIKIKYHKRYITMIVLAVLWYALWGLAFFNPNTPAELGNFIFLIIAAPILLISYWRKFIRDKIADEFMEQFAAANGYRYRAQTKTDNLKGSLFAIGSDKRAEDEVSGVYQGYPMRLFTYHYTVHMGRSSHTFDTMVFEVAFNTKLPDVLLSSRSQGFLFGRPLFLPNEIPLEGDLNKTFRLYADKGYEIEALQIFTPELLAHLVALPVHYTLEFINNKLYVYSDHVITKRNDLNNMYAVVAELAVHLGPFLARLKDDVQAMDEFYKKPAD